VAGSFAPIAIATLDQWVLAVQKCALSRNQGRVLAYARTPDIPYLPIAVASAQRSAL
jgi:hypothetical protein